MNYLNEMIEKMSEFLKSEAKTETIMGKEFTLGEFTCIPVMSIGLGIGGGGGEGKGGEKSKASGEGVGAGGGAGLGLTPVGFLAARGSDIQFIPAKSNQGLAAAFEKIPGLIDKYLDKNKQKETTSV